jgi:hypothetical protein
MTVAGSTRLIDSLATSTPNGRPYKFVFVCGHMRSGTNWVCNILRGHPDISVHGEGPFGHICESLLNVKSAPWLYSSRDEGIKKVLDESFADMVRNCLLQLATIEPNKSWVAESTSRQVWPYIPGTHHINIERDPRDVLTSWTFHQLNLGVAIGPQWAERLRTHMGRMAADPHYFDKHPHELFTDEQWVKFVLRGWKDFTDTAQGVRRDASKGWMDIKLLDLRYEALQEDAQREANRIFEFLDLDPAESTPVSAKNKTAPVSKGEGVQSHYRSGISGDWQKYANDQMKRWVKESVGQDLIRMGYENDLSW